MSALALQLVEQPNARAKARARRGVEQSYATALEWWRKAADQGHADAQYNIGVCYDHGTGVEQSSATALEWWRKAAAQGHAAAQSNVDCDRKG